MGIEQNLWFSSHVLDQLFPGENHSIHRQTLALGKGRHLADEVFKEEVHSEGIFRQKLETPNLFAGFIDVTPAPIGHHAGDPI